MILAATGFVTSLGGSAGALTGGSLSPTTLSASGDQFTINYTGKTADPATPNLIVEECIANDTKIGFDLTVDCSSLSRINFFSVAVPDGSVTYGGRPSNPLAPFVGLDPENGEWSVCDPGSGVTNYQSGFFRVADSPGDEADDVFIAFTCAGSPPPTTNPTTTTTAPAATTTTAPDPVTTTTTPVGETTTTTVGDETTTTLGDGATTTTAPDATTTTTPTADGGPGTLDDSSGDGGGLDGTSADALARTGTNGVQMAKLALLLVYAGWFLRRWGRPRPGKRMV